VLYATLLTPNNNTGKTLSFSIEIIPQHWCSQLFIQIAQEKKTCAAWRQPLLQRYLSKLAARDSSSGPECKADPSLLVLTT